MLSEKLNLGGGKGYSSAQLQFTRKGSNLYSRLLAWFVLGHVPHQMNTHFD